MKLVRANREIWPTFLTICWLEENQSATRRPSHSTVSTTSGEHSFPLYTLFGINYDCISFEETYLGENISLFSYYTHDTNVGSEVCYVRSAKTLAFLTFFTTNHQLWLEICKIIWRWKLIQWTQFSVIPIPSENCVCWGGGSWDKHPSSRELRPWLFQHCQGRCE